MPGHNLDNSYNGNRSMASSLITEEEHGIQLLSNYK